MKAKVWRILLWLVVAGLLGWRLYESFDRNALWCERYREFGLWSLPTWVFWVAFVGTCLALLAALVVTIARKWGFFRSALPHRRQAADMRYLEALAILFVTAATADHWLSDSSKAEWCFALHHAAPLLALLWLKLRQVSTSRLRRDWGLHKGRAFLVEAGWGLLAFLCVWPVETLVPYVLGEAQVPMRDYRIPIPTLVGASALFPKYQKPNDRVITLAQMTNNCIRLFLDGKGVELNSREAVALSMYVSSLSNGQTVQIGQSN